MKIIIFDGTFKTTTFINRLIKGLVLNHEVYVLGFNETLHEKIPNVTYIGLGPNNSKINFIKRSVLLRKFNLINQFSLLKDLLLGKKRKVIESNIQYVIDTIQPDIIHFQWVSVLSYFKKIQLPTPTKTILSQRGFHINVRPFINVENMQYLQSIFPSIDGFHSVSNAIKQKSNKIYQATSKIDHVVYSGFDYKDIPTKPNNIFSKEFKLISVGRNHWKKDYRTAIYAVYLLKNKGYKINYTIVGVEKDEELLFLVKDLELEEQIIFISNISQSEVYRELINADLFVLPSVEEGIANVCIEAMFCRLPVLSTTCGGMCELIDNNVSGFLVPTRSSESIVQKIEYILTLDTSTLTSIVNMAQQKVIAQHNTNKMVSDMEALYNEVYEAN